MRTITLAIAGLLLFSGCSSDPKPIEPKASPDPTSSATVPSKPAVVNKNSAEGAANFVKYWVDVSNYASQTGDVRGLRTISDDACEGCNAYIDLYERTYREGGFFEGSVWKMSDVEVLRGTDRSVVTAHITADPGRFRESRSADVKVGNAEDSDLAFGVVFHGTTWVMDQVGKASELQK